MILSAMLHAAVIAVAVIGLPGNWRKPPLVEQPIPVELVDIGDITNVPPPKAKSSEKPKEARKERPPEKPKEAAKEKPEPKRHNVPPPPQPAPEQPKTAQLAQPPKLDKAAKQKPEPKKKEEKKKPPQQVARAVEAPKEKPKAPKPQHRNPDFSSVLKTVEKIKRERAEAETEDKEQVATANTSRSIPDQPLTISELDAIRRQFINCWNVDPGLKGLDKMVVSIRVTLNPDRTVRDAWILDHINPSDRYYRSFAESALRAVHNPRCSPVKLPPKKFDVMQTFTLRFSAKEMLGL